MVAPAQGQSGSVEVFKDLDAEIAAYAGCIAKLYDRKPLGGASLPRQVCDGVRQQQHGFRQVISVMRYLNQTSRTAQLCHQSFQLTEAIPARFGQFPYPRRDLSGGQQRGLDGIH
ncbi:MAG: hypothetical protein WDZ76_12270 [Pseudohongiellaceae bacterium]